MKKSNKLPDVFYDQQIERMSSLAKFPEVPAAQKEIRRALRRISETDKGFVTRLITEVVDSNETCPNPAELIRRAGDIRQRKPVSVGKESCGKCHGTGFVTKVQIVKIAGLEPYESEFAAVCVCRGGK